MSIKIDQVSANKSILAMLNSYQVIGEKEFLKKFGSGKAKIVATDEDAYADSSTLYQSITSEDVGDCITVFAIEKVNGQNKAVLCWHISTGSSVEDLIELLEDSDGTKFHDIYIIGGTSDTTEGENCLLNNIHIAIEQFFVQGFTVKQKLINEAEQRGYNYVSANLHLDGTLTLCYHNT